MPAGMLIGLVFAVAFAALPSTSATITVVPTANSASVGDTIRADIRVSGVSDLYAFQFDLVFAPGILSSGEVTDGMFLHSGGFFPGFTDNHIGTVTFIADSLIGPAAGLSGEGTLATVEFTAVGPGTSAIALLNPILLDSTLSDISAVTIGTTVTVNPVPEPASAGVVLLGLFSMAVIIVRRVPSHRS